MLINASGSSGPPIYILEDKSLPPDDMKVYKVPGLHITTQGTGFGYVVFTKTRKTNEAFYKWFSLSVLIPFVDKIREGYNYDQTAWFQLDGEYDQISMYTREDVLSALKTSNICVGKPPGSTTSLTQPCEVGNGFRFSKLRLKSTIDDDVLDRDNRMIPIRNMFHDHETQKGPNLPKFETRLKNSASIGLLRVQQALFETLTPSVIMKSFDKTGHYPFNASKILSNFNTVDISQKEIILAHVETLTDAIMEKGELEEIIFESLGIIGDPKNSLSYQRRRSIIMTNDVFQGKLRVIREEKERKEALLKRRSTKATSTSSR